MGTFLTVILIILACGLLVLGGSMFLPHNNESVNIHLDKDTKMNISKDMDGVHIALVGGLGSTVEDDLFPQVDMTESAQPSLFSRDFWLKVADIGDLAPEERSSLCEVLTAHHLISDAERDYIMTPPPREEVAKPAPGWEEDPQVVSPEVVESAADTVNEDYGITADDIEDIDDMDF